MVLARAWILLMRRSLTRPTARPRIALRAAADVELLEGSSDDETGASSSPQTAHNVLDRDCDVYSREWTSRALEVHIHTFDTVHTRAPPHTCASYSRVWLTELCKRLLNRSKVSAIMFLFWWIAYPHVSLVAPGDLPGAPHARARALRARNRPGSTPRR